MSHQNLVHDGFKCFSLCPRLSGMLFTKDPILGTIPSSNLTPGKGGIGESYTNADWICAIRHGVKPDSRVEIFMDDYSTLSDQDLGDLIAYLIPAAMSSRSLKELTDMELTALWLYLTGTRP